MLGNFLSCIKGVKDPFEAQEGRCDFSRDAAVEKGPHLTLRGEYPGSSQVATANMVSLSIYEEDLKDPLVGASGTSSLHAR